MTTDRWRRVEALYHEMLARPVAERAATLTAECRGDTALQAQVQALLDAPGSAGGFLATPAIDLAAQLGSTSGSHGLTGQRVGVFDVKGLIGVGGMGEVYRARDTRLGRDVAIKILPRAFNDDPDRLARFEREARVLASLNHPHIGAIYGLEDANGGTALVMELVEGEDLSQRLARGAIPIDQALAIARQIAEALEAAHEQGIVHRDLKPANIKVRRDGAVKVLDFGLAKTPAPDADETLAPTANPTRAGTIMGTFAYMSPEQARGEPVGPRADIWSFGVVLYELLTGASPFDRPTSAETLASVLGTPPDYSRFPSKTPPRVQHLVRRCLEKDQKRRLQHMGDVRIEVEDALADLTAGVAQNPSPLVSANRRPWPAVGAITLAALVGITGWVVAHRSTPQTPLAVVRLSIPALEPPLSTPNGSRHLAISADGSRVAYASANRLRIRRMGQETAAAVEANAQDPFFSPDGEWVGFFGTRGGETGLWKVPSVGGAAVLVFSTSDRSAGGTWRADGTIVFATTEGLFQVSDKGGERRLLVKPNLERKEHLYAWPQFLPDGQSVLITIIFENAMQGAQIAVLDLRSLETSIVLKGGSAARYAPSGHLVYASGQTLEAVAFDAATHQIRGDPVSVPDIAIATTPDNGAAEFAVSQTGTLIFFPPGASGQRSLQRLWWIDRQGKREPLALAPDFYTNPRVSPDRTRVAMDIVGATRNIWIWNLQRPSLVKLTNGPTEDLLPVWSPDSSRVFFASNRTGNFDLYSQAADGATAARVEFAGPGIQFPQAFAPDGTQLLIAEDFGRPGILNLARPERIERFPHNVFPPEQHIVLRGVSPDGHWIAYESDESGGKLEVFVRPFPDVGGRREKISIDGGRFPLWGPKNSNELYYVNLSGGMMAASVKLSPTLTLGTVKKLFEWVKPRPGPAGMPYDISPIDGRFLTTAPEVEPESKVNISVVLNWQEELKRLVPTR